MIIINKMKYILPSLCLLLLFACQPSLEVNIGSTVPSNSVEISTVQEDVVQVIVLSDGATLSVDVAARKNWTANLFNNNAEKWCHLSATAGSARDTNLKIKVDPNTTYEERNASISIICDNVMKTIEVVQKQNDALLLSSNRISVSSKEQSLTISVSHNVDFSFDIAQSDKDWISNISSKALTNDELIFQIKENDSIDSRVGTIVFTSVAGEETVKIYQDGATPSIVLGNNHYDLDFSEQDLTIEIKSNVDFDYNVEEGADWLTINATKSISTHTLYFHVDKNQDISAREGKVTFSNKDNNLHESVIIRQEWDEQGYLDIEKETLVSIYKATNGDKWNKNNNWCSNLPVENWFGVQVNEKGHVTALTLSSNNVSGVLPPEIGKLIFLESLDLYYNFIGGTIPKEIGDCKNLHELNLRHNDFVGELPSCIGNLTHLEYWNFVENSLSGPLPNSIKNHPLFSYSWGEVLPSNNITYSLSDLPVPDFRVEDINGEIIDSKQEYANNKYTVLLQVYDFCINVFLSYLPELKELYQKHKSDGLEIILYGPDNIEKTKETYDLPWKCFQYKQETNIIGNRADWPSSGRGFSYPYHGCVVATVIKEGKEISFVNMTKQSFGKVFDYFDKEFGGEGSILYESTDFSRDGEVVTLQKAQEGNGINLILMGDGFSDRNINDGLYDSYMRMAYDAFFSVEPYSSYKKLFNVSYVNAVSKNETVSDVSETAFGSILYSGSKIDINVFDCQKYALRVSNSLDFDKTLVIMLLNSDTYAGTCHMLYPSSNTDYGDGFAIACCSGGKDVLPLVIHHEACGHGFAKLGDEYYYEGSGRITDEKKNEIESQVSHGWWRNLDFTMDPNQVKWHRFLERPEYQKEGLGCFEGGYLYEFGVWRPSEYSIMRYNTGGFNAPSREAIWYRIHKLAYGDQWKYSFESFLDYDTKNLNNPLTCDKKVESTFKNGITSPPVIHFIEPTD